MDLVVETLRELGGTASRGVLVRSCGRRAALALVGVLSHESAALWWGWSCGRLPERPVVRRGRP